MCSFDNGITAGNYSIIDELKEKYPFRPAMIYEREGLRLRLARKRN